MYVAITQVRCGSVVVCDWHMALNRVIIRDVELRSHGILEENELLEAGRIAAIICDRVGALVPAYRLHTSTRNLHVHEGNVDSTATCIFSRDIVGGGVTSRTFDRHLIFA